MKQRSKFLFLILLVGMALLPSGAFAADNIFQIISNKMISTVIDIRRIVYVIAGFGLIMFTTLAIFNKISFKHLAYIMIGLSLLAVMMPFINYFSGANLTDSQFSYGNFIGNDSSSAAIVGSDIPSSDGGGKTCTGNDCPSGSPEVDPDSNLRREMGDLLPNMSPGSNLIGKAETSSGGLAGIIPSNAATNWDSNGCRTKNGKQECCSGKIKNGACRKSAGQVMKDIIKIANAGIAGGNQALSAVEYAKLVKTAVDKGIVNVNDIISGDDNAIKKLGALASSVGMTADQVRSGTGQMNSNFQSFLGNLGYVLDGVGGNNSASTGIANSGVGAAVDNASSTIKDGANKGADAAELGGEAYRTGRDATALGNRLDGFFGGK